MEEIAFAVYFEEGDRFGYVESGRGLQDQVTVGKKIGGEKLWSPVL